MGYYERIGLTEENTVKIDQVKALTTKVLMYLPKKIGNYTDHGITHSKNIENLYLSLYKENPYFNFTETEKTLISLTIWTHDIGNILNRKDHEKQTIRILKNIPDFKVIEDWVETPMFRSMIYVIKAHRSHFDLISMEDLKIHQDIRLKLICAVFRMLDNCDLSRSRNSYVCYNILQKYDPLPPEHERYWIAHDNIYSVVFNGTIIKIGYKNKQKSQILISDLKKNLKQINAVFKEYDYPIFTTDPFKS